MNDGMMYIKDQVEQAVRMLCHSCQLESPSIARTFFLNVPPSNTQQPATNKEKRSSIALNGSHWVFSDCNADMCHL